MVELKIDLSNFPERFAENSRELLIAKKVNFIYGKNGTGKTTITDAIKAQYSDAYDVCIFKDFAGIVGENQRLDAIALGTKNTEIQAKIDAIDVEITAIKKEIEKPEDDTENLFTELEKANTNYNQQEDELERSYTDAARKIKNKNNPQIASTTYDKNNFKDEILQAKSLTDEDIKKYKETIKAERKETVSSLVFPSIDLAELLKSTNTILQSSVSQRQIIAELKDNNDKQNFAKEGLRIHEHKNGEKCAFCGNEISEERWQFLGNYFNDEVKNLESSIDRDISEIDSVLNKIEALAEINKTDFYERFAERIAMLNLQIETRKNNCKIFFETLKTALEQKKKDLFKKTQELTPNIPDNFAKIEDDYKKLVSENNEFSDNLEQEREQAKNALRYHEIKKELDVFKYDTKKNNLTVLKSLQAEAEKSLKNRESEFERKQETKKDLIIQTKNEKEIANQIDNLLKNMGVSSFSLELVKDDAENQKGQYKIKGHNGNIRTITELSKGEKNIIAFLYFILSLEQPNDNNKPKIIVLDDPMTSNDDTMQYLMIGEIQRYYKKLQNDSFFVLLTHNCHFYLNVRKRENKFHEKYGNFHLFSDGKLATIRIIKDDNDDFKTNYEMLWKELLFLYEKDKRDLMLNSCRRICETYFKFNCKDNFYESSMTAKKLFDVNQHSIDDLEAEQNGRTREEIKSVLEKLFENNNAAEHFKTYWKEEDTE
ncbi:putative AAA family ATPase [Candidatus Termititenax aidoneus]|uniref:AAA family ATPase n=1 Tax=Termititenax aidoneus TaxID=2218524 RepID=A0A388TBZ4_TERA1|nr:putative AAA family ATPase [Candidatus Termititenax aidoneus]